MRDRNDWGETLTATAAHESSEREANPGAVRGAPRATWRAAALLLPVSLSLTALLALPAFAQDQPAPQTPRTPAPAPPAPAPATEPPVAQDATAQAPVVPQGPKGRIRVFVRDAVTKDLLNDAAIFVDDPTLNELRSLPFYVADPNRRNEAGQPLAGPGFAVTDELDPHQWIVVVLKEGYQTGRAIVSVLPNQEVTVTVFLRLRERIEPFVLLSTRDTTNTTRRTLDYVRNIPVGIGNKQEINNVLASAPGFVRDSLGQVHPRGQRFGLSTSVDGFLLPSVPTGLLQGSIIPQEVIQQYNIVHGNLSPEFGGDAGTAINLTTRSVGAFPLLEGTLTTGGYSTDEVYVTVGQRFALKNRGLAANAAREQAAYNVTQYGPIVPGSAVAAPGTLGVTGPSFSYLLHVNQRNTRAVAESPQQNRFRVNNAGYNEQFFGKFELIPSVLYQISGLVSINGARSGIANRTREGGVGFLGQIEPIGTAAQQQAAAQATPSQDEEFQDQYQKENNSLALVQVRRLLRPRDILTNPDSTVTVSVGGMDNELRLENENIQFDPRDRTDPNSPLYKRNSSLEFNPSIRRRYNQSQSQIDLVLSKGDHVIKAGLIYNDYRSDEQYRFEPGSQVALDALFARSPLLVPLSVVPDIGTDGFGNQIVHYQNGQRANAPSGRIRRDGVYSAVYVQDTWAFNSPLTINAGFRLDTFTLASVPSNQALSIPGQGKTDVSKVSPRLNMAFQLPRRGPLGFLGGTGTNKGIFRVGYNQLFQRPPLGQGTYFAPFVIRPQTADQWEMSLEKQLGRDQVIKGALHSTRFHNFLDVTGLFPGAQFGTGALVLVNYPNAVSEAFELSYNYNPNFRAGKPLTLSASYTNGSIRLLGKNRDFDSLGQRVTADRASFDQLHTINIGASYRFKDGSSFGLNGYIGSGLYGSSLAGSNDRDPISEVNLRLSTNPRMFQKTFGFDVSVENLFDQNSRYNYFTGFEGSRYQVGRRILTSVYARF